MSSEWGPREPRLEIAQSELQEFQSIVQSIVGRGNITGRKVVPTTVDGESKMAIIEKSGLGKSQYSKVQLRDTVKAGEVFPYEEMVCHADKNGKLEIYYSQGATSEKKPDDNRDTFSSSLDRVLGIFGDAYGKVIGKEIMGEPIDEFLKIKSILEDVKRERSLKTRIKKVLFNRRNTS